VVTDALQQIPHQLCVKKRHRQFKQFYEEVADKRYVDTHGDMEQQPSADKIRGCASNNNHQFTKKHKPDEPYILMPDAYIHDRLREERHYQLQQAAEGQSKDNLGEIPAVLLQIAQQKTERTLLFRFFIIMAIEFLCRSQLHHNSAWTVIRPIAYPMTFQLIPGVVYQTFPGVSHSVASSISGNVIKHHKMILVPMQYARQLDIPKFICGCCESRGFQSHTSGTFGYAEHRDPSHVCMAEPVKIFEAVTLAVMPAYHGKTCHSALHGVMLSDPFDCF